MALVAKGRIGESRFAEVKCSSDASVANGHVPILNLSGNFNFFNFK